ncbi:MAG: hypothetical protein LBN05_00955 [Oscillospiraceae bacterium]|jgi:hypothetical protein|nr:hypothetical protein [Oscillospiraceae bacterium]
MTLSEKVAHLKGLSEGLGLDEEDKHGRLIAAIIQVLDEAATTVKGLEASVSELTEQLDAVDEDLDGLEEFVYEELAGEDFDDEDDLFGEDAEISLECPACGETFEVDADIIEEGGSLNCPACNELLEFEVSCDCGHEHHHEDEED